MSDIEKAYEKSGLSSVGVSFESYKESVLERRAMERKAYQSSGEGYNNNTGYNNSKAAIQYRRQFRNKYGK